MRIAYQGEPGAFSEAAVRCLSTEAQLLPSRSFEEVFASVEQGPAGYGVLPIENSIGGSIHRNYDLLVEHHLPIVGEVEVPVVHYLLALAGVQIGQLKRVYSHPQGLAQCERFLRTLTGVEIIATYDTAGSAKMVADGKLTDTAAIASARAGEIFGLQPLASRIQDYDYNVTRFIVIGRRPFDALPADVRGMLGLMEQNMDAPVRRAIDDAVTTHATTARSREVAEGDHILITHDDAALLARTARRILDDVYDAPGRPLLRIALHRGDVRLQESGNGSVVTGGGGGKGLVLPDNAEQVICDFFGVERLRDSYGMTEQNFYLNSCEHDRFHLPPWVVVLLLDPDSGRSLPRTGEQTGRAAFFDLSQDGAWGGIVSGDRISVSFNYAWR